MHSVIKGVKEVFIPLRPRGIDEGLDRYLTEIERNLRELASRTYIDTEAGVTDTGSLSSDLQGVSVRVGIVEGKINQVELNILGIQGDISDIGGEIDGINDSLITMSNLISALNVEIGNLDTRVSALEASVNQGGAVRPNNPALYMNFFDTSLGYSIWWNGTEWVDSEGNIV